MSIASSSIQPTVTAGGPGGAPEALAADFEVRGYRILRRLGLGGMGVVFLAEQREPVRRQVALKFILNPVSDQAVLARFEQERQALARMNHPNIAQVFDAGTTARGQPFFVMEYVEGVPISEFCDARSATLPERLRLFRQVCDGVQHAHQRGVIHRDLKPSNVLVSVANGAPLVKIIDFGVARTLDREIATASLHTQFGQLMGTPAFMSPEQAELGAAEIDTRSDVYALGVILYQLLTDRLPYEATGTSTADMVDLLGRIRRGDAPRASAVITSDRERMASAAARRGIDGPSLVRALGGDLDWIVTRAMERDRDRRYAAASELSADVERHLAHQPVLAGPPSITYRASKFIRRHWLEVTAATLTTIALLGAVAGGTAGMVKARRAEAVARDEATKATLIYEFLLNILGSPNPSQHGRDVKVVDALERAEALSGGSFAGQPLIEAGVRRMLARTYFGLGLYDRAVEERRKEVELRGRAQGQNDRETLEALADLSEVLLLRGPLEEIEPEIRDALERTSRALGDEDPLTLHQKKQLAAALAMRRDFAAAEPLARSVVETRRRLSGTKQGDFIAALSALARIVEDQGRLDEAEQLHREVLAASIATLGPEAPESLNARNSVAGVLGSAGKRSRDSVRPWIARRNTCPPAMPRPSFTAATSASSSRRSAGAARRSRCDEGTGGGPRSLQSE